MEKRSGDVSMSAVPRLLLRERKKKERKEKEKKEQKEKREKGKRSTRDSAGDSESERQKLELLPMK